MFRLALPACIRARMALTVWPPLPMIRPMSSGWIRSW